MNEDIYGYSIDVEKVYGKFTNERYGVVLNIRYKDQKFKWLASYEDVAKLIVMLGKAETINQNLTKQKQLGGI